MLCGILLQWWCKFETRSSNQSVQLHYSVYQSKDVNTHTSLKSLYPERNPELGFFLSGAWDWFAVGAQEQLWSDALPDATNEPNGIWAHDSLTMSRKHYPLSHGCQSKYVKAHHRYKYTQILSRSVYRHVYTLPFLVLTMAGKDISVASSSGLVCISWNHTFVSYEV